MFEAHPENRNQKENRKERKNEGSIRNQRATDEVLLLRGNWGFIIITEIYPTVTRNRGNSAFSTVIGFTVTREIMNSSVMFCTVLVNKCVFFAVTGGTITVIVFNHGNGLHGNYRSLIAVKIPRENPRGKPWLLAIVLPLL